MVHERSPDRTTTPAQPIQAVDAIWQLPAIMFACWLNMVGALWLLPPPRHKHLRDPHDQLVVPDPLEEEGEHALFA